MTAYQLLKSIVANAEAQSHNGVIITTSRARWAAESNGDIIEFRNLSEHDYLLAPVFVAVESLSGIDITQPPFVNCLNYHGQIIKAEIIPMPVEHLVKSDLRTDSHY